MINSFDRSKYSFNLLRSSAGSSDVVAAEATASTSSLPLYSLLLAEKSSLIVEVDGVCSVETASLQEEVEIRVGIKFPRDENVDSRRKAGDKLERKRVAPEAAMDGIINVLWPLSLTLHSTEHTALSLP